MMDTFCSVLRRVCDPSINVVWFGNRIAHGGFDYRVILRAYVDLGTGMTPRQIC